MAPQSMPPRTLKRQGALATPDLLFGFIRCRYGAPGYHAPTGAGTSLGFCDWQRRTARPAAGWSPGQDRDTIDRGHLIASTTRRGTPLPVPQPSAAPLPHDILR